MKFQSSKQRLFDWGAQHSQTNTLRLNSGINGKLHHQFIKLLLFDYLERMVEEKLENKASAYENKLSIWMNHYSEKLF